MIRSGLEGSSTFRSRPSYGAGAPGGSANAQRGAGPAPALVVATSVRPRRKAWQFGAAWASTCGCSHSRRSVLCLRVRTGRFHRVRRRRGGALRPARARTEQGGAQQQASPGSRRAAPPPGSPAAANPANPARRLKNKNKTAGPTWPARRCGGKGGGPLQTPPPRAAGGTRRHRVTGRRAAAGRRTGPAPSRSKQWGSLLGAPRVGWRFGAGTWAGAELATDAKGGVAGAQRQGHARRGGMRCDPAHTFVHGPPSESSTYVSTFL
jgi:hypothetical protein